MIIGLTGPTGAGKSTACAAMRDSGCAVIDADQVAREVVRSDSPCLEELTKAFGRDILRPDGMLSRSQLAQKAFSSHEATARLNAVTHPYIMRAVQQQIEALKERGARFIVLDAPLLFESGADKLCDVVVAVTAPLELRLKRIMQRDGISREAAEKRIGAQREEDYYTLRARYVLDGAGKPGDLYHDACGLIEVLREESDV